MHFRFRKNVRFTNIFSLSRICSRSFFGPRGSDSVIFCTDPYPKLDPDPNFKKKPYLWQLESHSQKEHNLIRNPVYGSKDPVPYQNVTDPGHF